MWRNDIGNIDIIDATQEGCSNDHQYEHEPKKRSFDWLYSTSTTGSELKLLTPHHVIYHLPDGDLQSSQGLVGWQDVRQPCKAQHAGDCKQHL